ncbi:MAG: penicillin-binding protein 2 [Candidatus Doudnabacteria bacterium]|nr:penicillin-binding protein 2 [Candidatus Doudnabacteria bacterium]
MSKQASQTIHKRVVALTVILLSFFAIVLTRLFFLQVVQADEYKALAEDQYTLVKKLTPSRGEIKVTDKFSPTPYTVATNIEKDLVFAIPSAIENTREVAEKLSPILGIPVADIEEKIVDKSKKYVPLKKQITEDEVQKIKDLKISGISFDPQITRFYPEKTFLSNVLGFVGFKGDEKKGLYGLESYFDLDLAGVPGSLAQEKDATGSWIFGAKRELRAAEDGDTLLLTVDKTIQFKVESVLKEAVENNQADSGSIVVMDPKTGAIMAMASYPNFDPNEYGKTTEVSNFNNLNTVGNYEPGSVFKAFTMAAAIDQGKVTPNTTYNDTGEVVIDQYTIKNSDKEAHGIQTMTQALEQSLNTGLIFAKEQIGNAKFLNYIQEFGFGEKTNIELPETSGNLSNLSGKIRVNFHTASFGQGISVTPIQLVKAYGALANGGKMMQPYIVQSIIEPNGHTTVTESKVVGNPITDKTASTISAMLVNVVENGHGKRAGVPGYYIAGKTGTAQVPRQDGKGYETNNNIGSFAGYGPVEDPRFVMVVRINHPRTVQYAESTAAPAFGQIAQFILNYYNIQPNRK